MDGRVWAIPWVANVGLLDCRRDLLARAGLAPPASYDEIARHALAVRAQARDATLAGFLRRGLLLTGASPALVMGADEEMTVAPLYLAVRALGLRDTWAALVLADTSFALPLALFPGVFEVPWGDVAAAAMLVSLPRIAIVFGLQRHLLRGLLAGSVKESAC